MDIDTPQNSLFSGYLFLFFLVTLHTIEGVRLFDTHLFVAPEALLMIGTLHSGPQRFLGVKGLAMTTVAAGRLLGGRTVVMARLANRPLLPVKILRQLVVLGLSQEFAHNLAVGEIDRLVLFLQIFDGDCFRYILIAVGVCGRRS